MFVRPHPTSPFPLFGIGESHNQTAHKGLLGQALRQKFQRAFAQEVLCPWAALEAFVGPDEPDDDMIGAAAWHFHVSQRLIETTLVNKGRMPPDVLPA